MGNGHALDLLNFVGPTLFSLNMCSTRLRLRQVQIVKVCEQLIFFVGMRVTLRIVEKTAQTHLPIVRVQFFR